MSYEFYTMVPKEQLDLESDDENYMPEIPEYIDPVKIDYSTFPSPESDLALPMSFLSIKTVEEGMDWYREHHPAVPEDMLPYLARYHWGDLHPKVCKVPKKKNSKKKKTKEYSIKIKRAPPGEKISVSFD